MPLALDAAVAFIGINSDSNMIKEGKDQEKEVQKRTDEGDHPFSAKRSFLLWRDQGVKTAWVECEV